MRAPIRDLLWTGTVSRSRWSTRVIGLAGLACLLYFAGYACAQVPDGAADAAVQPVAKTRKVDKGGRPWLPLVLVGVVTVVGVTASLLLLRAGKRAAPLKTRHSRRGQPQTHAAHVAARQGAGPEVAATETLSALDATAIGANLVQPETALPAASPGPEPLALEPLESTAIAAGPPRAQPVLMDRDLTLPAMSGPVSRGNSMACTRCSRAVSGEHGTPPWCPHCGADLKANGVRAAVVYSNDPRAAAAQGVQPPYFMGRLDRTYRIYVLPSRLLFLDAPGLYDVGAAERIIQAVSIQGGLLGWMIGSAVSGKIAGDRRARTRNRTLMLDVATTEALVEMGERESTSFCAEVDDLEGVCIEGLNFWQNIFAYRCAARLHLRLLERGPVVIDLPTPDDVRVAIKQLGAVLGARLTVHAAWDWSRERFIPKD